MFYDNNAKLDSVVSVFCMIALIVNVCLIIFMCKDDNYDNPQTILYKYIYRVCTKCKTKGNQPIIEFMNQRKKIHLSCYID
jgi:hypothetical protein